MLPVCTAAWSLTLTASSSFNSLIAVGPGFLDQLRRGLGFFRKTGEAQAATGEICRS
jgi:hypothetical protein